MRGTTRHACRCSWLAHERGRRWDHNLRQVGPIEYNTAVRIWKESQGAIREQKWPLRKSHAARTQRVPLESRFLHFKSASYPNPLLSSPPITLRPALLFPPNLNNLTIFRTKSWS